MPGLASGSRRYRRALTSIAVCSPGFRVKAVGAAGAARIEQAVDRQFLRIRARPLDPECHEARKLLSRRVRRVDRQRARRNAVQLALAKRAEVARAKECQHLVLVLRRIERIVHAKTGIAEPVQFARIDAVLAVVELLRRKLDWPYPLADDFMHADSIVELRPLVKEGYFEGQLLAAPEKVFGAKTDIAVSVIAQPGNGLGQIRCRRLVSLGGKALGLAGDVVEAEGQRHRPRQQPKPASQAGTPAASKEIQRGEVHAVSDDKCRKN